MTAIIASCGALAPEMTYRREYRIGNRADIMPIPLSAVSSLTVVTRRSATFAVLGLVFVSPGVALADAGTGVDDDATQKDAAVEAAKERMRQRIAASKKNYRKPTDLVKERKENTDYSCVAATGSPCPEGLVPRAVQREIIGALEKFE